MPFSRYGIVLLLISTGCTIMAEINQNFTWRKGTDRLDLTWRPINASISYECTLFHCSTRLCHYHHGQKWSHFFQVARGNFGLCLKSLKPKPKNKLGYCLKLLIGYSMRGYQIELIHLSRATVLPFSVSCWEKDQQLCLTSIVYFAFYWLFWGKFRFWTLAIEICRIEKDIVFL